MPAGTIAYRVVAASASTSFDLLSFIRAKEQMTCNLDDLDDWEVVDVDLDLQQLHIPRLEQDDDEELQSMLNSWCSMERYGDRMDSELLRSPPPSLSFVSTGEYQRQMMRDEDKGGIETAIRSSKLSSKDSVVLQRNGAGRDNCGNVECCGLEEEMAEFEQMEGLEDEWEVVNDDYLFSYDILEGSSSTNTGKSMIATVPDLQVFLPHLADALAHNQVEEGDLEDEDLKQEEDEPLSGSVLAEDVDDDLL